MREASDVRRSTEKTVTPTGKRYSEDFKLKALALMGARGRNAAARELGVSKATLQTWTEKYPVEWSEAIRGRDGGDIQKELAAQFEELIEGYTEAEQKALGRALETLDDPDLDARDIAALIKAMGSSRGVAAVNARQARGEPDKSVDVNINFPQLEQAAEAILAQAPQRPALPVENLEESSG